MAPRRCMVIQNRMLSSGSAYCLQTYLTRSLTVGMLQGSTLSALLFSIDRPINEIDESVMFSKTIMYAGDKQLYISEDIQTCIVL